MYIVRSCSRRGALTNISNFMRSAQFTAATMDPNQHPQASQQSQGVRQSIERHSRKTRPSAASTPQSRVEASDGYAIMEDLQAVSQSFQKVSIVNRATPSRSPVPPSSATKVSAREVRDAKVQPSPQSGGIPNPSMTYITSSLNPPIPLREPQHLLVIIDLNGTLLYRPSRKQPTKFVARPHTRRFLQYCIDTFTVVIWSSARPENVRHMCDAILTGDLKQRVAAIWGRDKFNLSKQDYDLRVQCYKRLTNIWEDWEIARSHPEYNMGGRWDQTNTVLIDDSIEKGRSEPYNLIEIPEFFGDKNEQGEILPQVHDYLNHLSLHSNVSACLRAQLFKAQAAPRDHHLGAY